MFGTKQSYRPEIDGLRAIAILAVIAFHMDLGLDGGYVGVDIFFVISGFLITNQIDENLIRGTFSLSQFYQRRIKRLLPAAFVMMAVTCFCSYFLLIPSDYREFGQSLVAQGGFGANFYFFRESSYFSHEGIPQPLLHCWSLAVEEQFYFLFPVLYVVLFRLHRALVGITLATLAGASLLLSIYYTTYSPMGAFFLLPTRAWELLVGVGLALFDRRFAMPMTTSTRNGLAFLGGAAILTSILSFGPTTSFPGYLAGLPCLGSALLILAGAGQNSIAGRILRFYPLVFIGQISYSLYLWHWPVVEFSKVYKLAFGGEASALLLAVLIFGLGVLSWKYLEQPIRRGNWSSKKVFFSAAIASLMLILLGLSIHFMNGMRNRLTPLANQYADGVKDRSPDHEMTLENVKKGELVPMGVQTPSSKARLFLWGDSHAKAIHLVLDRVCLEFGIAGEAALRNASAPLSDHLHIRDPIRRAIEEDYNQAVIDYIREQQFEIVVVAARWNYYLEHSSNDSGQIQSVIFSMMRELITIVPRVIFVKQVPEPGFDVPRYLAYQSWHARGGAGLGLKRSLHDNRAQEELFRTARSIDGIEVLDPSRYLMNQDRAFVQLESHGKSIYMDDNHLSVHGALLLTPLFSDEVGLK